MTTNTNRDNPVPKLLHALKEAFDARLIAEVHQYGGIPHLSPEETELRQAISALLIAAFPDAYEVVETT